MKIDGRRVVITGGTSGIGYALAEALRDEGARVLVCGRDAERLRRTTNRLGLFALRCDVSDAAATRSLVEEADGLLGGIDVLVHNAGIQRSVDLVADREGSALRRELDVNLAGPIELTAAALPLLREGAARGGAALVFVTSALAIAPRRARRSTARVRRASAASPRRPASNSRPTAFE